MAKQDSSEQDNGGPPEKSGQGKTPPEGLDELAVLGAVCHLFCMGYGPTEIAKRITEEFGVKMTRQQPYPLLAKAARMEWMQYIPPPDAYYRQKLKDRYKTLVDVEVVQTPVFGKVANYGAASLMNLVCQLARPPSNKKVVQIGFSGGPSMMAVAREFAELLSKTDEGLPETIIFRALVSAYEINQPYNDPNAFFTLFVKDNLKVKTEFICLRGPLMVKTDQFKEMLTSAGIAEAHDGLDKIDIVVTSGSCWKDQDSLYRRNMSKFAESAEQLQQADIVGDMMLLPLGPRGPLDVATETRALTVLELADLQELIKRGTHVLLVLGPCGGCHTPKTAVLKSALSPKDPMITHLVVDTRTAAGLFPGDIAA